MDQSYQTQGTPQTQPKNWLVEAILVTIFCCLPFGIAGIVFATQVNSRYVAGDYAGALRASQDAGRWTKIGFWAGVIVVGGSIIFTIFFGGLAIWGLNQTGGYND